MDFELDKNGFLKVKAKLANLEPLKYYGHELNKADNSLNLKENEVYQVFRDKKEFFNPQTIKSFEGVSVTLTHPSGNKVNSKTWKSDAVGHVQNIRVEDDFLVGDIFIKDDIAIRTIKELDIKDISPGYNCDFIFKDGKLYQTNINGNHVAIVANARAQGAKIGDSKGVFMEEQLKQLLEAIKEVEQRLVKQEQDLSEIKEEIKEEPVGDGEPKIEPANQPESIEELKIENEELKAENEALKAELEKVRNENSKNQAINDAMSVIPNLNKDSFKNFKTDVEIRAYAQGLKVINPQNNSGLRGKIGDSTPKKINYTAQFGGKK